MKAPQSKREPHACEHRMLSVLVLCGAMASCRLNNPRFDGSVGLGTQQDIHSTQSATTTDFRDDSSSPPTSAETGPVSDTGNITVESTISSSTPSSTAGSNSGSTSFVSSSETTDSSSSTSSNGGSSTGSTGSSTDTSSPICNDEPALCYEMFWENVKDYAPYDRDQPPFKLQSPDNLVVADGGTTPIFKHHAHVNDGGRLIMQSPQPVGAGGFYAFDVSVKQLTCDGPDTCIGAKTGDLALVIHKNPSRLSCVGANNGTIIVTQTVDVDFAAETTIGCFVDNGVLKLVVAGNAPQGSTIYTLPAAPAGVEFEIGAHIMWGFNGVARGRFGRFRYWTDKQKMLDTLAAGP